MNIIEHMAASLSYRWSRVVYNLWIKPINTIRFNHWKKPQVATLKETLNHIIEHKSSICRYGDGEFNIALGNEIGFQHICNDMPQRMYDVLQSNDDNILIGIPDIFESLDAFEGFTKNFWTEYRLVKLDNLKRLFPQQKKYYNSFITRFTDFSVDQTDLCIPIFRKIWDKRDVYIVEGEQTRVGVGNDLLDNAANVYRILAPAKNAYDVYDKIVGSVQKLVPEGALIIIALGPTATILAYDLAKMGYQALDLGHFDIQYECHLRGISSKEPIPGKYVNEAAEAGQTVDDSAIKDKRYEKSIIDIIKIF